MLPEEGLTPDSWAIIRLNDEGGVVRRILSVYHRGYPWGDDWRLSSAIADEQDTPTNIRAVTESGSSYILSKSRHGLTSLSLSVYNRLQGEYPEIEIEDIEKFATLSN